MNFIVEGKLYIIGGNVDPRFPYNDSRFVTSMDVAGGPVGRIDPLPEAISRPAVATAPSTLIVCGGSSKAIPMPTCQFYSLKSAAYVPIFLLSESLIRDNS